MVRGHEAFCNDFNAWCVYFSGMYLFLKKKKENVMHSIPFFHKFTFRQNFLKCIQVWNDDSFKVDEQKCHILFFFFHEFFSSSCNQCKNGPPRRHIEFKLFLLSSAVTRHQFCGFSKDFVAQYRNRKWGFEVRMYQDLCQRNQIRVFWSLFLAKILFFGQFDD